MRSYGAAEKDDSVWRNAVGGSKGIFPLGRRAKPKKGRQRAKRTLGGGSKFPLQGGDGMALKILTQAEDMPDGWDNIESNGHIK